MTPGPEGHSDPTGSPRRESTAGDGAIPQPESAEVAASPSESKPVRSILKWVLAAVILALVAYPLVQRIGSDNGASATSASAPGPADTQLNNSMQLYQTGKFQQAIDAARAAIKIKPDMAPAYNNIAVSYLALHQYDEAIQNAREALRIQPGLDLAKNNLAWIQQEKAKASGQPQPVANSGADAYVNQSLQNYQAGRFQQAIDAAQQALKLDPAMPVAYNNIAASYASMGMWDKSIENAQKALDLKPDFQLARNNLNWALKGKATQSKK